MVGTNMRGRAFLLGADARAVDVEVAEMDARTWRLSVIAEDLSPVVSYLLGGDKGALLIDPGSSVTWPGMLGALKTVRESLDIRWVFGHCADPSAVGALPLIESTLGSQVMLVTAPELLPAISHYGTRLPIQTLSPGSILDIGRRRLVAEYRTGDNPLCLLRDTHSGAVYGAGARSGDGYHLPGRLESVRADLEHVLLTTLAPIALEGRALAALAPVGRVTALRSYMQEDGTWFELGGRAGIRGRALTLLPAPAELTVRVELTDPTPVVLDLRFSPESAQAVTDPDIQRMFDSLRRPLATAMRRILSMRESIMTTSQLRADIRRDPLTGVGNRRAMDTWSSRDQFAALMIDLDHFKLINDNVGHHSGDSVLRLVAEVIGSQIRAQDLLVRYGGDEFLLLLDGSDDAVAEMVARRIRASVAALDGAGLSPTGSITVSIGVAAGQGAIADVIAKADIALYEAKSGGRDRVCVAQREPGEEPHDKEGADPPPQAVDPPRVTGDRGPPQTSTDGGLATPESVTRSEHP